MQKVTFDYFTLDNYDEYSFLRIPKRLMTDARYADISIQAKLLYGLLLFTIREADENGWYDEWDRAYIGYPLDEMQEDLGVSKRKISDCMSELEEAGLVEKRHRGQGKPNIIYVKNFLPDIGEALPGSQILPFRAVR